LPATHGDLLSALDATDPNDVLTALLDLQQDPLPAARGKLVALLDHESPVVWRNAALALHGYDGLGAIADEQAKRLGLRGGKKTRKSVAADPVVVGKATQILGALRHPAAAEWLVIALESRPLHAWRVEVAWGLGLARDKAALPALVQLARDADAQVRAEAALALGRLADPRAGEVLAVLESDADPDVAARAKEAAALMATCGGC
jgi:HEAT repeat protein